MFGRFDLGLPVRRLYENSLVHDLTVFLLVVG